MGTVDCNNKVGFKDFPEHAFIFEKLINILHCLLPRIATSCLGSSTCIPISKLGLDLNKIVSQQ